jgi:NADPH-dependent 2,4-dienoyl-CoA reductase/sulfur reductase-like enzyme
VGSGGKEIIESPGPANASHPDMTEATLQKTVVVGAGPVGALAALYAARRGHDVEVYELRSGTLRFPSPLK